MKIKEIELNNFRIYNGKNTIDLTTSDEHNIIIVSGENGFGKTTFLMSIVWCLYGRQMELVDEMYKAEISSKKGGYNGYMSSCLNKTAEANGDNVFSVSLTLTGLDMPNEIECEEIKITRSYNTKNPSGDDLQILFDAKQINEIFPSVPKEEKIEAEEYFIRDRIMPIEIAKFFFFDAERIVAYAKLDSLEQQKKLADAYSQVLGIQKYISLKESLTSIKDEYRKKGANSSERDEFNRLTAEIDCSDAVMEEYSQKIAEIKTEIKNKKDESNSLLKRLLLEGNVMTQEQLSDYRIKQQGYKEEMDKAQTRLKDLYNYIPFGLSGELFSQLVDQVKKESEHHQRMIQLDIIEDHTNDLLNELDEESYSVEFAIDRKIRRFYEDAVKKLIKKHFYKTAPDNDKLDFIELHGFTDVQSKTLISLVSKIKSAKRDFTALYDAYHNAKREYALIEQQIRVAEAKSESPFIQKLKEDKKAFDDKIEELEQEKIETQISLETKKQKLKADKQRKEILAGKLLVLDEFKVKDKAIIDLIQSIDTFLVRFKEEKKLSLQKKILSNLKMLLHKKNLISDVNVFIQPGLVDISLIGENGNKQEISDLSNGEKQMFSTALLSALVEETGLQFPVFIDSPLQKFDRSHSKNILEKFYPKVSQQVVLFPLLYKELTDKEYLLIRDRTDKTILIQNKDNCSKFLSISKCDLFNN
ncbi:DNA sulfur modification protein DndD [Prevotella sp.]|uniref:DNA sulfur modification protein DndD n=1 Tax=Prevotella sp. TaxID=59823 RepID=UPI00264A0A7B|nr:DNA sulfur modification protein DndD [Prevotella sp.]MDN5554509.1 DNA sulfur modification protein DndD [Prevotella sp.]